ncbi:MAG: hypothetical protein D6725_00605 [Planctomycetota bacterium]|nr:MAG: hypothetical protein D6725_00605 [Planctomycetota bacterium]
MPRTYDRHGIRFSYPEQWELTEERQPEQITIGVSNAETTSWNLCLLAHRPPPRQVLSAAADAFRDEFSELDEYDVAADTIGGHRAIGKDLEFFCLELLNSASLRVFQTEHYTVLLWWQGTDTELESTRSILEAITDSLRVVDRHEP